MSRAAVYDLIANDMTLNQLGINATTIHQVNALDVPEIKPFVIVQWQAKTVSFASRGLQNVAIWAHDERGDYIRIDTILERVIEVLTSATHISGSDGHTLTCVRYDGTSDDLWDDGYRTITRYCTFGVLSRVS